MSRLIIQLEEFEPAYAGCYNLRSECRRGNGARGSRAKLGEDGNQIGAHSALRPPSVAELLRRTGILHSALEHSFPAFSLE